MALNPTHPIYTIGHSTRSEAEFLELLRRCSVQVVVDVRKSAKSKSFPRFSAKALKDTLAEYGIGYLHFPELGGRRVPVLKSKNTGWSSRSLQGYADHMESDVFEVGLQELLELSRRRTVGILCVEALPWQCHRNLIADALTVRNHYVIHILGLNKLMEHKLTPWAKVRGLRLSYPSARPGLFSSASAPSSSSSAERGRHG